MDSVIENLKKSAFTINFLLQCFYLCFSSVAQNKVFNSWINEQLKMKYFGHVVMMKHLSK